MAVVNDRTLRALRLWLCGSHCLCLTNVSQMCGYLARSELYVEPIVSLTSAQTRQIQCCPYACAVVPQQRQNGRDCKGFERLMVGLNDALRAPPLNTNLTLKLHFPIPNSNFAVMKKSQAFRYVYTTRTQPSLGKPVFSILGINEKFFEKLPCYFIHIGLGPNSYGLYLCEFIRIGSKKSFPKQFL